MILACGALAEEAVASSVAKKRRGGKAASGPSALPLPAVPDEKPPSGPSSAEKKSAETDASGSLLKNQATKKSAETEKEGAGTESLKKTLPPLVSEPVAPAPSPVPTAAQTRPLLKGQKKEISLLPPPPTEAKNLPKAAAPPGVSLGKKAKGRGGRPAAPQQAAAQQAATPKGKLNEVPFARALPEDIFNSNFPDTVESFHYPGGVTLSELTEAVGKLTGINFMIDGSAGLSGKRIQIIAPSKITVAEAYKAFLSALRGSGFTLVRKGPFWKITPVKQAVKDSIEIYSGDYFPNTDQMITRIMKLKYIKADKFAASMKFYLSQENAVSHIEAANSVIITDFGSVIEKIEKMALKLDIPGSLQQVKIIPIEYADAGDIGDILNQLIFKKPGKRPSFSGRRGSRKTAAPVFAGASKSKQEGNIEISAIISDERTNSLVVSANEAGIQKVQGLVKKLDTYVDPIRNGGVYVYKVLYGTAEQLYNTLTGMSKSKAPESSKNQGRFYRRPSAPGGGRKFQSPLFENITIMVDNQINSLIINAQNRYDIERLKAILKKIDIPRDQVFVRTVIAEMAVAKGDHWEMNIINAITKELINKLGGQLTPIKNFFLNEETGDLIPIAGFSNQSFDIESLRSGVKFGPGLVLGLPLAQLMKRIGTELSGGGTNPDFPDDWTQSEKDAAASAYGRARANNQLSQLANFSIMPLIQILQKSGNFNILSAPQIAALDNVKAVIEVGEEAPVGLSSTTATGSLAVNNSVERQNITIKLDITPSINADSGTVQMKIKQTMKDFSPRQSTAGELRERGVHILTRDIDTTLVLNDGETAILGGLMIEKENLNENKIPFLGDIPVLGRLFKGSVSEKQKQNLLVFITPQILRGGERQDMQKLLGRKLEERLRFVKKNIRGKDPYKNFLDTMRKPQTLSGASPDDGSFDEDETEDEDDWNDSLDDSLEGAFEDGAEKESSAAPSPATAGDFLEGADKSAAENEDEDIAEDWDEDWDEEESLDLSAPLPEEPATPPDEEFLESGGAEDGALTESDEATGASESALTESNEEETEETPEEEEEEEKEREGKKSSKGKKSKPPAFEETELFF